MDKRKEANLRVKSRITNALFALMEEKSLADIHIAEIVGRAGVARSSFYRNYCSKEDVLVTLIRDILEQFRQELDPDRTGFYSYETALLSFRFFRRYRSYILDLCACGFLSTLLEELNCFHERMAGDMPCSSMERYQLYIYIGALLNTALTWLSAEDTAGEEEIARFFYARMMPAVTPEACRLPEGASRPAP